MATWNGRWVLFGAVTLIVATSGCYDSDRYLPFSPSGLLPNEVLRVTADRPVLPADGFSRATITVELLLDGDRQQPVTFSSSRGTLYKVGSADAETRPVVTADAWGVARVPTASRLHRWNGQRKG